LEVAFIPPAVSCVVLASWVMQARVDDDANHAMAGTRLFAFSVNKARLARQLQAGKSTRQTTFLHPKLV
jgi:hypothetical protein